MSESSKPFLILDAYLDEQGGARNFLERLGDRNARVVRVAKGEPLPTRSQDFAALLVTGSAASILDPPDWLAPTTALVRDALSRRTPYLGLCFGHQLLAHAHGGGGAVVRSDPPEFGWIEIERTATHPLLAGLEDSFVAFESHKDEVARNLAGVESFARSRDCAVQGFGIPGAAQFGVQFHPEMGLAEIADLVRSRLDPDAAEALLAEARDTTGLGDRILANFLGVLER